ncbi:hypothetical protein C8R43DRAFT_483416 [Mycena crocata]|nr:hypothetical protein C8R43DRAFT_483416 [Mycena crocata]
MEPGGVFVGSINDAVMLRNSSGDGQQSKDVMVAWQVDFFGSNIVARALQLRSDIIGPEEDCGPTKPKLETVNGESKLVGGFKLERDWRSLNLEGAPRAYPISTSVQVPRGGLHAPAAGNKFYGLEDDALKLRKEIMKFMADVSMLALDEGPPGLYDLLYDQGDIMNVPPVGSTHNKCFSAMQVNISHPEPLPPDEEVDEMDGGVDETIPIAGIKDLGNVGRPHLDKGDAAGGVTCATCLSQLEPGIDPGDMLITELGIAFPLLPLSSILFCGLRPHGGTNPTYDHSTLQLKRLDNIRAFLVAYMTAYGLGGEGITAFAALPEQKLLTIGPELRSIFASLPENTCWTEQANFVMDGAGLMSTRDHITWSVRETSLLLDGILNQLPNDVRFDREMFYKSISWVNEQGVRESVKDWPMGPGYASGGQLFDQGAGSSQVPFGNKRRWDRGHEFIEHQQYMGSSISVVNLTRQTGEDGKVMKGRPATFKALSHGAAKGKNVLKLRDALLG